ncbi:MAG: hypothetical protein JO036_20095 [Candidatus Eremiobacteraeota bacterium]|nr:hypothetical protein [Candidatus Eremiobacteraeota bacterium]
MSLTIIPIVAFSMAILCTFVSLILSIKTWREDSEKALERERVLRQFEKRWAERRKVTR